MRYVSMIFVVLLSLVGGCGGQETFQFHFYDGNEVTLQPGQKLMLFPKTTRVSKGIFGMSEVQQCRVHSFEWTFDGREAGAKLRMPRHDVEKSRRDCVGEYTAPSKSGTYTIWARSQHYGIELESKLLIIVR